MQTAVPVIADDRERRGGVVAALIHSDDFDVRVERLESGDYRVDDRFLFERKTLPDLASSIASGRLFKQMLRLVSIEGLRPALVLEGRAGDLRGSGMSREAIQGALLNITLLIGIPVLRSQSPTETARLFLYAARQGRAVTHGCLPRHGGRPRGKPALQNHLLQGLPGVGPERARRLLKHFGSVQGVMTAGETALADVQGIGRTTAHRIAWAVKDTPGPYIVDRAP